MTMLVHTTTEAAFDYVAVDRRGDPVRVHTRAGMRPDLACSALALLLDDDELRAIGRPCGACAAASRCSHPFATTPLP